MKTFHLLIFAAWMLKGKPPWYKDKQNKSQYRDAVFSFSLFQHEIMVSV